MENITSILILVLLPLSLAYALLHFQSMEKYNLRNSKLINKIDLLLPQTQCGACTYPGCRPYAQAIVKGVANINQCPPGGLKTIGLIAEMLGREVIPVDASLGQYKAKEVAFIDEDVCIGCVKCIRACPVDAILGAPKQMHTIIANWCTGCELCIDPCPVDCITMIPPGMAINQ